VRPLSSIVQSTLNSLAAPGIALWLVPPPDSAAAIALTHLNAYRPTSSSPRSYPIFAPHITLASIPSSPSTVARLREAVPSGLTAPLHVRFAALEVGDHFFRSVLLAIERNVEIVALHAHIHAALGSTDHPNTPRFPHLSVYYIADEDEARRREAAEKVREEGMVVDVDGGVAVVGPGGERVEGFIATEVWIAQCDGPVEGWRVIEKITLGPK